MYKVCITKRPREILQRLTGFKIKKNDILRLSECLELSESTACYQKSWCDCIVALCILLKTNSRRCKDMVPLFDIYTPFSLSKSPSQTRVMRFIFCATAIFTEICRCSSWQRRTFIELFWLCSWKNCAHLQTKGWYMTTTLGQWCKISDCGFTRWLDYQPWRVMEKPKKWLCALWTGPTKTASVVGII